MNMTFTCLAQLLLCFQKRWSHRLPPGQKTNWEHYAGRERYVQGWTEAAAAQEWACDPRKLRMGPAEAPALEPRAAVKDQLWIHSLENCCYCQCRLSGRLQRSRDITKRRTGLKRGSNVLQHNLMHSKSTTNREYQLGVIKTRPVW